MTPPSRSLAWTMRESTSGLRMLTMPAAVCDVRSTPYSRFNPQFNRETLAAVDWPCTVVANADDPLVAWSVRDYRDVTWVAGGMWWDVDGEVCRTCRVRLHRDGDEWSCATCGLARAEPAWRVAGDRVLGPGLDLPLDLRLPGRTSASNALFALAGAAALGVDPARALAAISRVDDVDGRWRPRSIDGRVVRIRAPADGDRAPRIHGLLPRLTTNCVKHPG